MTRGPDAIDFARLGLLEPRMYSRARAGWSKRVRALRRARRVELGAQLTLLFETPETLAWHINEVAHIEGKQSIRQLERVAAEYLPLFPRRGELTATLMIHGGTLEFGARLVEAFARGDAPIELQLGALGSPAYLVEDAHHLGAVIYLGFAPTSSAIRELSRDAACTLRLALDEEFAAEVRLSPGTVEAVREALLRRNPSTPHPATEVPFLVAPETTWPHSLENPPLISPAPPSSRMAES